MFRAHTTNGGTANRHHGVVAKKIFLTKGVGKHREGSRVSSSLCGTQDCGVQHRPRLSIFPPNCKLISRSEGLKHIRPGQVAFTVISENSTKEAHRLIAASIGLALPATIDVRLFVRASLLR